MNDHLFFLKYENHGTEEERNWEAEKRGILGITMGGPQESRCMCQAMPSKEGRQDCTEAGPAECPTFFTIPEVPSGILFGEGVAGLPCQS